VNSVRPSANNRRTVSTDTKSGDEAMTTSLDVIDDTGSRSAESTDASPGDVVVYRDDGCDRRAHDHATTREIARRLAALKGYHFAGDYEDGVRRSRALYFVPIDTLIGIERARALGVVSEQDLFGGVAPHPFVATKCISHPLVDDAAAAPDGWSEGFARRVRPAVLDGFAAFSADDARCAARRLLAHGPVRIKRALGIGGHGQVVVENQPAAERALADVDRGEVSRHGIALEQDLANVTTHSVGQVRVDELVASYCGMQRVTENNSGRRVYGGSDLLVARGDFDALIALVFDPAARCAIEQARLYDDAAFACFAGLFASRRNYDVAQGVDASGQARSGVLEQSWRIGGASGAEIAALAAFRANRELRSIRACSREIYGAEAQLPAGAILLFQGDDPHVGPLTKYALTEPHGDA